jgi:hypothetical protein
MLDFFVDDIEEITGVRVESQFNKKGADILFITPSGDVFADPGTYTCMGYLLLFIIWRKNTGWISPGAPMPPRAAISGFSPPTKP